MQRTVKMRSVKKEKIPDLPHVVDKLANDIKEIDENDIQDML
jgi:hypothetical protein